jgi:hypothetical protein
VELLRSCGIIAIIYLTNKIVGGVSDRTADVVDVVYVNYVT